MKKCRTAHEPVARQKMNKYMNIITKKTHSEDNKCNGIFILYTHICAIISQQATPKIMYGTAHSH